MAAYFLIYTFYSYFCWPASLRMVRRRGYFESTTVLRKWAELYQLSHQGVWQGLVRWKADRAFARVVVLELVLEGFHHGTG